MCNEKQWAVNGMREDAGMRRAGDAEITSKGITPWGALTVATGGVNVPTIIVPTVAVPLDLFSASPSLRVSKPPRLLSY